MLNPYSMQQQVAMGMGLEGQYAHYGYQQGPSQYCGENNIFECNPLQAYQFGTQDELQQVFMMEASRSPATAAQLALNTEGLMNVMNNTPNISNGRNWSREMYSIMIAVFGRSRDGFMQWPEFLELQECLFRWFNDFMQYDVNRSGFIEAHEVVNIIGYQQQQATLTVLLKRYSRVVYDQYSNTEKTCLTFDDFVSVCVRLRAYTDSDTGIASFLLDDSWRADLESEFQKPYFKDLENILKLEYKQGKTIFPPKDLIFNALNLTPFEKVKVVILGQDPYHDDDQAMGLSFSVPKGIKKVPQSLKNIYEELVRDPEISGFMEPNHGCLEKWAKDGVLLLNATLTVEAHKPNSHASFGWQKFTDHVVKTVSDWGSPAVFILWGNFAHKKEKLIDKSKHKVIKTAHPSSWSHKFKGCGCFSQCNTSLIEIGQTPIDWSL